MTRRRGETTRKMTTLGLLAAATFGAAVTTARPASAQDIERVLAGIRLNSKSSNVLAKFGNPNEVVIGDIGFRGTQAAATGGASSGDGGLPGLQGGGGGTVSAGAPSFTPSGSSGSSRGNRPSMGVSGPGGAPIGGGAPSGGSFGGPPPGFGAPPSFGAPSGDGGGFGQQGGLSGGGGAGDAGSTSGAIGPFGQSVSTLARQQEVTWIYNRKVNDNLVTYNFLIGANGNVVQIMVTGYKGGNSKTKRGIALGSTYKDVVALYGYPESQSIVGRALVASYRTRAHVEFQFLPQTPQNNPLATGNKCIAVTIATVE